MHEHYEDVKRIYENVKADYERIKFEYEELKEDLMIKEDILEAVQLDKDACHRLFISFKGDNDVN